MSRSSRKRIAVIGAGAAGSMAAVFAAAAGAETLVLERTNDGGRKILISGGGRCNVLPARLDERRFITDSSPHTLRKIVRSWPLAEQVAFFERDLGLALMEETESAKLFPVSQRARDVRDGLLGLARRNGATILTNTLVTQIAQRDGRWYVERQGGAAIAADAVIVATGGLSVPKTGSDGTGLRIVAALGHTMHPTYPALTPIEAEASPLLELAGVSLRVTVTAQDRRRDATAAGGFLFTHRGYSGPAALDVSHVLARADPSDGAEARPRLFVRWADLDDRAWHQALMPHGSRTVGSVVRGPLPVRLADAIVAGAGVDPARPLAQLHRDERLRLVQALTRGELPWTGHEGYKKAEVTGGGVALDEIDPRTMESRRCPGLFLCGEILDAFGPIGGYNFLLAWATGRAAGQAAARQV